MANQSGGRPKVRYRLMPGGTFEAIRDQVYPVRDEGDLSSSSRSVFDIKPRRVKGYAQSGSRDVPE